MPLSENNARSHELAPAADSAPLVRADAANRVRAPDCVVGEYPLLAVSERPLLLTDTGPPRDTGRLSRSLLAIAVVRAGDPARLHVTAAMESSP
jgi:hypothetical protein